jgi:hypothetical protein
MEVIANAGAWTAPSSGEPTNYLERLRVPALSVGTYRIPAGGHDDQKPHTEDEIYVVAGGRARLVTPTATALIITTLPRLRDQPAPDAANCARL